MSECPDHLRQDGKCEACIAWEEFSACHEKLRAEQKLVTTLNDGMKDLNDMIVKLKSDLAGKCEEYDSLLAMWLEEGPNE